MGQYDRHAQFQKVCVMDGRQIESCLRDVPGFIGVFCSDDLVDLRPPESFSLVVNTDKCNQPGSHWQAIVVKDGQCNFFCSFGGEPQVAAIRDFCARYPLCVYNNYKHQRVDRTSCGGFAVYFIWAMACGQSHSDIVARFQAMRNDDDFIKRFMRQHFSVTFE